MVTSTSLDWIFFDCFNTLIDDFDTSGYEAGLAPMYQVPVTAGLYTDIEDVRADYHRWRLEYIAGKPHEQTLQERFRNLLAVYRPEADTALVDQVLAEMEVQFMECFPATLRLPAGVESMLQRWQDQVSMGVISNFFLADWPGKMLERYGLNVYFQFVLDSAECGKRKPSDTIYQMALEAAGNPAPERVLFIGDHLTNDAIAPQRLGMRSIYFDRSAERASSSAAPADIKAITHWDQFIPYP
ncbi:HAD family hydrolase [Leptolyngbyaceae cyanobacterium CCMR0082]|uniref:HAD family hydrolase n=2 Tax=Adonisia turfae TaxID=2950184 RepID=A0A6M0S1Z2_9CYAN|nr:HAD family hydrolase [Adonisia turfae]NEZ55520.1 HAD family hydrolase [Adonisia turfae CCMR0081]NEZ62489.1 HAD family hydrolase [Adonisia turfae CCMR0082]